MRSVIERMALLEEAQELAANREYSRLVSLLVALPRETLLSEPELAHYLALAYSQTDAQDATDDLLDELDVRCADRPRDRLFRRRLNLRAVAMVRRGRLSAAEALFREIQASSEVDADDKFLAMATVNLGVILDIQSRFEDALAAYHYAIVIFQRLGETTSVAACYHNLGMLHRQRGELWEAEAYFQRALENYGPKGTEEERIAIELERALVLIEHGHIWAAVALAELADRQAGRLNNARLQAECARVTGRILNYAERFAEAEAILQDAMQTESFQTNLMLKAEIYEEMAVSAAGQNDNAKASIWLGDAIAAYDRLGSPARAANARLRATGYMIA